ncbi:class I adenylate-forming enzyme family protein [Nocardioides sp. SLBN-35]|uniref:class I adenylate-forming enzyme family protein n=1 Tax=Nocardioides sp. SLBN-35 TaxID=2768445 RepID=UPI001150ADEF|nr:class I adenylate-forming enzyme family protein [Nocardioides sp. SLBN-35]TQK69429.1 acyl-CoA synthetase (AMP-forming)/AMP-acid ligase II [Nocardioides sp. SLBN-35]
MIRLLERAAAAVPDQPAVITTEATTSYADLLAAARSVGAALRSRGIDRFAVVEPDAGRVLTLLAGAALVGAEPCQYQPDIDAAQFREQAEALGHTVVVSRREELAGDGLRVVGPDELVAEGPVTEAAEAAEAADQPILIRTTGTTGLPKAARHDWSVLARTTRDATPRPGQHWLLAYGPQQFAGIQVLQHVMAIQGTLVAPFPRQPRDGLDALLGQRLDCVSATPTYWRFLLAEARGRGVALPPLTQITLGGEASSPDLLAELRAAFPDTRISQVYASTEFGSIASVGDGRPGLSVASLWSPENPDGLLRVVEGQLWVRAGTGMSGYAGDRSDTPAEEDGWVATGDLAEVVEDRVLFRGRNSDVINVGGVKVHPLPVEERIAALPGVSMARVFGRPNRLTGAIVATEVVPVGELAAADAEALKREVRAAVADLPPAWRPRSIALVEELATKGTKTLRGMAGPES